MYRKDLKKFKTVYRIIDFFIIIFSLFIAHYLRMKNFNLQYRDQILLLYSIISWFSITKIVRFYDREWTRSFTKKFLSILKSVILFFFSISLIAFFFKTAYFSRLMLIYFSVCIFAGLNLVNLLGFSIFKFSKIDEKTNRRVLVVGAGRIGYAFYQENLKHPEYGYDIVAFIDDKNNSKYRELNVIGKISDLKNQIEARHIDIIVVALSFNKEEIIKEIFNICDFVGVRVKLIPDFYRINNSTPDFGYLGKIPLISFHEFPLEDLYNKFIKRTFDIIFSGSVLFFLSPLFLFISLFVKLSSKGPILFKQYRAGYNQKEFLCYKFRSMYNDYHHLSDSKQAEKGDSRITKIGSYLRKFNLDEFPQFWNVLKGDMSVVGPRPHMLSQTDDFRNEVPDYLTRHFVRPGITGLAQIRGWRGPTDTEEKKRNRIKFDLRYIRIWSFTLDLKIIFLTVFGSDVRDNAF